MKDIISKKAHGNNVDCLTIEITSKKVCENNVDFSTIKIKSDPVCGNNAYFLTIEITKSTWKRRGFFDQRNYIEKVYRHDVEIR